MLEIAGLGVLSPIVGLYQVQVDGFAWLNLVCIVTLASMERNCEQAYNRAEFS